MATLTKEFLSASAYGIPIKIVATATTGTTVHTAPAGTTGRDVVTLYATNNDTTDRTITVEFGTTDAGLHIVHLITAGTSKMIIPGIPLANGLTITAYVTSGANVVAVWGFVDRQT